MENYERKLAKQRNHLVFNLRCRDENIVPPSLRLKCPIDTDNAKKIVDKARKELVRERIRLTNNKITSLKQQKQEQENVLFTKLPSNEKSRVVTHVTRVHESTHQKTKWCQMDKLECLMGKKPEHEKEKVDLSGTQLKRWVVNLSKRALSEDELKLLAKGLNFTVTPDKPPTKEIIVATESVCHGLNKSESDQLRTEIVGAIKSAKVPEPNLTKKEKTALVSLMKDPTVMVLPADKGKATVLMDTVEYEEKVNIMLQDEKTYEKLPSDPMPKYKQNLVSILSNLRKENKLTEAEYRYFYPTSETTLRLYCTPKIHKKTTGCDL